MIEIREAKDYRQGRFEIVDEHDNILGYTSVGFSNIMWAESALPDDIRSAAPYETHIRLNYWKGPNGQEYQNHVIPIAEYISKHRHYHRQNMMEYELNIWPPRLDKGETPKVDK